VDIIEAVVGAVSAVEIEMGADVGRQREMGEGAAAMCCTVMVVVGCSCCCCEVGGIGGGTGTGRLTTGAAVTSAGDGVALCGDATELMGLRLERDREDVMLGLGAGGHCTTDTGTTIGCPGSKHMPAGSSSVWPCAVCTSVEPGGACSCCCGGDCPPSELESSSRVM
jgi:hypothetical protein